jgi:hypothetical protein
VVDPCRLKVGHRGRVIRTDMMADEFEYVVRKGEEEGAIDR